MNQFESALACDCLWHLPLPHLQYPIHQPIYWFCLLNISSSRLSSLHFHGHLPGPRLLPNSALLAWHAAKTIYCHRILVRENTVFICRAPRKENGQLMLKGPKLPVGLHARVFKDNIRGKSRWICDWLMTVLLIGWCWGDRVISQEFQSSVFWLQPVWSLDAWSQRVIHTLHLVEGSVLGSTKQPKDICQDIVCSSRGGTKYPVCDLWLNCCSDYYYFPCLTAYPLLYIFSFL